MTFIEHWQAQLPEFYVQFAQLATEAREIDLNSLIAAAILWPVRRTLEEDEGFDALAELCGGAKASQIIKAIGDWGDDSLAAARDLATQSQVNERLRAALRTLIDYFQATSAFVEPLAQALVKRQGGDVYHIAGQIKAALVNIGGTTNIQSLTVQLNLASPPPAGSPEPPFTVPPLPDHFVERPAEFDPLLAHLLPETPVQNAAALITVVQGGGGFGKTTLTQALCHHPQVQAAFADGILWIGLGQTPNLLGLLADQINLLSTEKVNFSDLNLAAARWRSLLTSRRVLLVLDDVWEEGHARPFLPATSPPRSFAAEVDKSGEEQSSTTAAPDQAESLGPLAILITTRRQDLALQLRARAVTVSAMNPTEAANLLLKWLDSPPADPQPLLVLAHFLGEWPLLLRLAGAYLREMVELEQQPLDQAIAGLRRRLEQQGFTYLDRADAGERDKAISISLDLSLERLGRWQERYLELAVFPPQVDLPFATLARLWEHTAHLDELEVEDALRAMQRLSLFTRYDPVKRRLGLHEIIRAYLAERQQERLPALHGQLLDAFRPTLATPRVHWAPPPEEPYLWDHLAYHLVQAGLGEELVSTVKDLFYLTLKSYLRGALAVENDLQVAETYTPDDAALRLLRRSLVQSSHLLNQCRQPKDLTATLYSRLWHLPTLADLVEPVTRRLKRHVFLPRHPLPDLPHPALIRTLSNHTEVVTGCAVSADGRVIVSTSEDRTLRVWDSQSGSERLTLTGHTDWVSSCAISADGQVIVSASADQTVKVWEASSGQNRLTLQGHTGRVSSCAVSVDGQVIVSASDDKTLRVWEVFDGRLRLTLTGHTGRVNGCAISPDGRVIVSASDDQTLKVWDAASGAERLSLVGHTARVNSCAISTDGQMIVSASDDRTLKVWDAVNGVVRLTLAGHTGWVKSCAISDDGQLIISAAADKTLKVWEAHSGALLTSFSGHTGGVLDCAVSADGRLIISAAVDKTLKVWDTESSTEDVVSLRQTETVLGCAMRVDGRLAVTVAGDRLTVWNVAQGVERFSLSGHTDTLLACAVSADGRVIVSASADKTLRVWNATTGVTRTLAGHTGAVLACAVSENGRVVVSASADKTLKVWDVERGTERLTLAEHQGAVWGCSLSADGQVLISASTDRTLRVWNLEPGTQRFTLSGHKRAVKACAVSADGRIVVSASEDHTLIVREAERGTKQLILTGHTGPVTGCTLSADGQVIFSVSADRTIKAWAAYDGHCLATLRVDGALHACACSADGQQLVVAGRGGVYFLRFLR